MQRVGGQVVIVLVSAELTSLRIYSGKRRLALPGKGAHYGRPDHATQRCRTGAKQTQIQAMDLDRGRRALALLLVVAGVVYFAVLPTMYSNTAHTYYDKGEYDRAIAEWDKAIEINPRQPAAFANRGLAFYRSNDQAHAIARL